MSDNSPISRRKALLRVTAMAAAAYATPMILTVTKAQASSSGGGSSGGGNSGSGSSNSGSSSSGSSTTGVSTSGIDVNDAPDDSDGRTGTTTGKIIIKKAAP